MRQTIEESKRDAVRNAILDSAKTIIENEGVKKVSIRRIASDIGYSPGSIYQYFHDKESIVTSVIESGYNDLMKNVMDEPKEGLGPEALIKARFMSYARAVLEMPFYYKHVMFSDNDKIVKRTAVLDGAALRKRPAFDELIQALDEGKTQGVFNHHDSTLHAQLVWTAVFGTLSRAIIEGLDSERTLWFVEGSLQLALKGIRKK